MDFSHLSIAIPAIAGVEWLGGLWSVIEIARSIAALGPRRPKLHLLFTTKTIPVAPLYTDLIPLCDKVLVPEQVLSLLSIEDAQRVVPYNSLRQVLERVDRLFPFDLYGNWCGEKLTEELLGHPAVTCWLPNLNHLHISAFSDVERAAKNDRINLAIRSKARLAVGTPQDTASLREWHSSLRTGQDVFPHMLPLPVMLNPNDYPLLSSDMREEYKIPEEYFYCPNPLYFYKNHHMLVQALITFQARGMSVPHIVCTGGLQDRRAPEYQAQLSKFINETGLAGHVHLLGVLPRNAQLQIMRGAKAVVLASHVDGWCEPLAEARALGVRCICADNPWYMSQSPAWAVSYQRRSPQDLVDKMQNIEKAPLPSPPSPSESTHSIEAVLSTLFSNENMDPPRAKPKKGPGAATKIKLVTSLSPRNIAQQQRAVASWQDLGFDVIAINFEDEIEKLRESFPNLDFHPVPFGNRTLRRVLLDEVFDYLRACPHDIVGIINSDIYLEAPPGIQEFLINEAKDALIITPRVEVESFLAREMGTVYSQGFDWFIFPRKALDKVPQNPFGLGIPWWDYYFPLLLLKAGYEVRRFCTPVAYHPTHATAYSEESWYTFGFQYTDLIFPDFLPEPGLGAGEAQIRRIRNAARRSIRILTCDTEACYLSPEYDVIGNLPATNPQVCFVKVVTQSDPDWLKISACAKAWRASSRTAQFLCIVNISGVSVPPELQEWCIADGCPVAILDCEYIGESAAVGYNVVARAQPAAHYAPVADSEDVRPDLLEKAVQYLAQHSETHMLFVDNSQVRHIFDAISRGGSPLGLVALPEHAAPLLWRGNVNQVFGGFDESLFQLYISELLLRAEGRCRCALIQGGGEECDSKIKGKSHYQPSVADYEIRGLLMKYSAPPQIEKVIVDKVRTLPSSSGYVRLFNNWLCDMSESDLMMNQVEPLYESFADTALMAVSLSASPEEQHCLRTNIARFVSSHRWPDDSFRRRFMDREWHLFSKEEREKAEASPKLERL